MADEETFFCRNYSLNTNKKFLYFAVFTSFLAWPFNAMGRLTGFVYSIDAEMPDS
jgi:hypothetical protein